MAYEIELAPEAWDHLNALPAARRAQVWDAIEEQLSHQPKLKTKNRKPMRENPVADWELRVGGDMRVYYEVSDEPAMVYVVAIGIKKGNQVRIGGEVVDL